jgi:NADH:ubiquinone reductase (non-electrogenic)
MKRRAALCLALGSCLALTAHGFAPPAAWHGAGTGLGVPLRTATAPARPPPVRAGVSRRGTARALPSGGLLSVRCQNDDGATPHKSASVTGKGTRVCIVGGGFGGLYTALQLARLLPLQSEEQRATITLVDSSERFVFLPMLYELVTGELKDWEVAPVFSDLLEGTGIEFVHGNTTAVDHRARTIDVDVAAVAGGGRKQLVYDKLVIATGASASMPAEARGAGALSFMRVEDAKALRARLGELRFSAARRKQQRLRAGKSERPAIAIVGGGYSGVELACSLAESVGKWADVKLIHRGEQVMAGADRFTRITSYQELQRRGVAISTSTSVSKIEAGALTLSSNGSATERVEDFDLLVWTAGTAGNPLIQEAQLPVTPEGRLPVDSYLRVRGESDLYCLGDVAECFDALNDRMAPNAQVALQQSQTLPPTRNPQPQTPIPEPKPQTQTPNPNS